MLKTGFIGQRNVFDILICDWLAEHTNLELIIWTDGLSWCRGKGGKNKECLEPFRATPAEEGSLTNLQRIRLLLILPAMAARAGGAQCKRGIGLPVSSSAQTSRTRFSRFAQTTLDPQHCRIRFVTPTSTLCSRCALMFTSPPRYSVFRGTGSSSGTKGLHRI